MVTTLDAPQTPPTLDEVLSRFRERGGPPRLGSWSDEWRVIPSEFVRGALFAVGNRKDQRAYLKGAELGSIGDVKLVYTGLELRGEDQDVWLELIHQQRHRPLGEWLELSPYRTLRNLGWPTSKPGYDRLRACLSRMQANSVSVVSNRLRAGVSVSLVRKFVWQDDNDEPLKGAWRVWIEPEMALLFHGLYWTRVEWAHQQKLGPLAKWLYSYFASHAVPYPVKVQTIRHGCGAKTRSLPRFRQALRKALADLERVGFLEEWEIDQDDLVHVRRTQARGLPGREAPSSLPPPCRCSGPTGKEGQER